MSSLEKKTLRSLLLKSRNKISSSRRAIASQNAYSKLSEILSDYENVLSFASLPSEINLWKLNQFLAEQGKLLLPRTKGFELSTYKVRDLQKELLDNPKNQILEPKPELCEEIQPDAISCVLVPAIVFDPHFHRLGFGKGCYDRFLTKIETKIWGVGFREQLLKEPLPIEAHDIPVQELFLF